MLIPTGAHHLRLTDAVGYPFAIKVLVFVLCGCAYYWDNNEQGSTVYLAANCVLSAAYLLLIAYDIWPLHLSYKFFIPWSASWCAFVVVSYKVFNTKFPLTIAALAFASRAVMLRLRREFE